MLHEDFHVLNLAITIMMNEMQECRGQNEQMKLKGENQEE